MKALSAAIIVAALLIAGTILYVNQEPEETYGTPQVEFTPRVPVWDDPEWEQQQLEQRMDQLEREQDFEQQQESEQEWEQEMCARGFSLYC